MPLIKYKIQFTSTRLSRLAFSNRNKNRRTGFPRSVATIMNSIEIKAMSHGPNGWIEIPPLQFPAREIPSEQPPPKRNGVHRLMLGLRVLSNRLHQWSTVSRMPQRLPECCLDDK